MIRDSMLAVAGVLDPKLLGPGTLDPAQNRRSVYFTVKRSRLIPMMVLFDAPDALQGIGVRPETTIAPQSLMLLNNPTVREWASAFAKRLRPRAEEALSEAVEEGYRMALSRSPTALERKDAEGFLKAQWTSYQASNHGDGLEPALIDFCQVLMGLNEFVYIE
jgi:hypothetical protein